MAGFDFRFCFQPEERDLVVLLLRAAQRRARAVDVQLTYAAEGKSCFVVVIDGSLIDIEPLALRLSLELPSVAEGFSSSFRLRRRRRLAVRLTQEITAALGGFLGFLLEAVTKMGGIPHSLTFDAGNRSHIQGRLNVLTRVISLYLSGGIDPETTVEELHTAVETVLKEGLGVESKGRTFAALVKAGEERGWYRQVVAERLLALKDHRKLVKHHGQGISASTVDEVIFDVVMTCQVVTAHLRGAPVQIDGRTDEPGTAEPGGRTSL
jgi:hypothetical protein